jgi:peptidoglycan hydrolase-like protein with peptidoglycan-binding domain
VVGWTVCAVSHFLRVWCRRSIFPQVTHTPPGTGTQLLRRGDRGAAVATWQWRLRLVGQTVDVDEDFGPATEAATRTFQQANGLTADGVVGPLTRRPMERSLGI